AVGSTMRQSCVTVKNDAGVERQLKNLLLLAETKRRKWRELHAPANGEADAPSPRTEENETVKRTNKRECEVKSKSGEGGKESSPLVDAVSRRMRQTRLRAWCRKRGGHSPAVRTPQVALLRRSRVLWICVSTRQEEVSFLFEERHSIFSRMGGTLKSRIHGNAGGVYTPEPGRGRGAEGASLKRLSVLESKVKRSSILE
ncbi:hypothetical protein TGARI_248190C, partial [Toxoplasma gondii ARI]